jgi:hypothetical protein
MRAGTRCTTRTQGQQGRGKGVCVGVHTKRTARVDAYRYWVYYVRRSHTHGRTQDINEGMTVYGRSIMHETPSMIDNNAHAWRAQLHGSDALSRLRTTTLVVSHSAFRFTEPECFFAALLGIHVADCVCVCVTVW